MKREIEFIIEGECKGKGRPRFARQGNFVRTYTDEATSNYENWVKLSFINSGQEPFLNKEPLYCEIIVRCDIPKSVSKKKRQQMIWGEIYPAKKPDCDNIAKSILDGLNKVAFTDDTQIVELKVKKIYAEKADVSVRLKEL